MGAGGTLGCRIPYDAVRVHKEACTPSGSHPLCKAQVGARVLAEPQEQNRLAAPEAASTHLRIDVSIQRRGLGQGSLLGACEEEFS